MIWTGHTLPGTYNGLPIEIESTSGPKKFNLAKSSPVGLTETFVTPLGAEGRTITIRAVFMGQYFEAHKALIALLDATVTPVPGVLVHPVWGSDLVYPESYTPTIDAAELTAVVEVQFQRHFVRPEILVPGVFTLTPWLGESVPLSLAAYASMMAFLAVWNSALLAAALLLIRLLASVPVLLDRSIRGICGGLAGYFATFGNVYAEQADPSKADPTQPAPPPDRAVRAAFAAADAIIQAYITAANVPVETIDGIAAGTGTYNAGSYGTGRPAAPGEAQPTPRLHATLLVVATWEAAMSGRFAAMLADLLARQAAANAIDASAADSAVIETRRRIQRANLLLSAAMGVYAAPVQREIATQAAQLTALLGSNRRAFPAVREVTVKHTRPLALIALDELGDAERAPEIRALNSSLHLDFNRLSAGTVLSVPAA